MNSVNTLLAAYFHDLSPFVLRLWGDFGIRWYGLAYLAGFAAGWFILKRLARRRLILIPESRITDAILFIVFGVVLGGRLGYAVAYDPSLFSTFSSSFPWWGLLEVHHGGMASHGGIVGIVLACWRISRGWKEEGVVEGRCPMLHVMDAMTLVGPVGVFFGRIANFVNGELLGRVVAAPGQPAPWWSVKFPQEVLSGHAPQLTPEQARSLAALVDSVSLPTDSFAEGYARLLARIQSGAPDLGEKLAPLIAARHPSQLYQAVAEGLLVGGLLWGLWAVPRRPGFISAWFLIAYGGLRILTEFWRLPDPQFLGQTILGIPASRGQALSALMISAGLALLVYVHKRGRERLGGWRCAGRVP